MKYGITRFKRYVPVIEGMRVVVSYDHYSIIEIANEVFEQFPKDLRFVELTESEASAWKFYGSVRGYRSAYSDVEGLEPDADELAKGKRKTKIYMIEETTSATVSLMKKIFKCNILDVYDSRENQEYKEEILSFIDSLQTIKQICYQKERLLGTEMSKIQLKELYLWDDDTNSRVGKHEYTIGF
jgi:hypothetical protein